MISISIHSILWYFKLSEIITITIDGPENISKRAFIQTTSLETVVIKTDLVSIHPKSFEGSNINSIRYEGTNEFECNEEILPTELKEVVVPIEYESSQFCGKIVKKNRNLWR